MRVSLRASDIGHSLQVLGDEGALELVRALAGSE